MSQTNIDYLFQVVAPAADRAASAPRSGNDSNGFNDHLSQASASVFNVLRTLDASPTRDSTYSASRVEVPRDSSISKTRSESNSAHNRSTQVKESGDSPETCGLQLPSNNLDSEPEGDGEEVDSSDAAEVAAAAGVGASSTKEVMPSEPQGDSEGEQVAILAAKEKIADDDLVNTKAIRTEQTSVELTKTDANENSKEAFDDAVEVTTAVIADGEAATDELVARQATAPHDAEQVDHTEATKEAPSDVEKPQGREIGSAEIGEVEANVIATVADNIEPEGDVNATSEKSDAPEPKRTSDEDAASDPDVGNGSEPTQVATKNSPAAVVNNIVATIEASVGSEATAKEEPAAKTKAIAAKQEASIGPLGRAMKSATDVTRAQHSNEVEMPHVDPARFVGRVAKAFQTASERDGTLQLRLSPPELGALKLQLTVKDGVMSAQLETENAGARRVLLEHLPMLRDRLAEQSIRIDRFDVDVRQENNGEQANPRGSNQNPEQPRPDQSERQRTHGTQRHAAEIATPEPLAMAQRISTTGINLVI